MFPNFQYDIARDVITINGLEFSGAMFRDEGGFTSLTPPDRWLRVVRMEDGVVTVFQALESTIKDGSVKGSDFV